MSNVAKLAVAAVVVVIVGGIGLAVLRPSTSGPGGPAVQPSASPSAAPGSSAPPALTAQFVSAVNGYSIAYPAQWKVTAASRSWASGSLTSNPDDGTADAFNGTNVAIYVVSQKLAADTTPAKRTQTFLASLDLNATRLPECTVAKSEPIVVDGVAGVMDVTCPSRVIDAIVISGGRAYDFTLGGDPPDKTWFLEVLKMVKLHPKNAVDASPPATP